LYKIKYVDFFYFIQIRIQRS